MSLPSRIGSPPTVHGAASGCGECLITAGESKASHDERQPHNTQQATRRDSSQHSTNNPFSNKKVRQPQPSPQPSSLTHTACAQMSHEMPHAAAKKQKLACSQPAAEDNQPAIKKEEAEPESQGFVSNKMRPFVPQLMEAAQKAADGHALNLHACAAHRGVPDGSACGAMSHFFDGTGDTYDNAVDKPAWVKETSAALRTLSKPSKEAIESAM
eukprot:COSAG03_NODE_5853_length_1161_cov_1.782486_1_plen_213_part_00